MDPLSQRPATSSSLYVGDLPIDLVGPEDVLYGIFNKVGLVMSIKVCRDINTQRSLGYAYVNFQSAADAERALRELNYSELPNRPGRYIRIMWSTRDPTARKIGNGNIFIKNLDPSIDIRGLRDAFSRFGEIQSCKLALDEQGVSRGYGFVHFEKDESATQAIAAMNNEILGGQPISVTRFIKRSDREKEAERTFTNVYIKNIRGDATEEDVRALVASTTGSADNIASLFLSSHPQHRTKFALVSLTSHEAAVAMIEKLHNQNVSIADPELKLYVCRALKRTDRQVMKAGGTQNLYQSQGRNIYVKHLDDTTTKEQLEELFAPFGKITSSALMYDAMGNFRGFAFVCFESKEAATAAIREMNGKLISRRPLYVSQAQQKDRRHQFLEDQRKQLMIAHQQRVSALFGGMMGMWPPGGYRPAYMGNMGAPMMGNYVAGRPVNNPRAVPPGPNVLQPPPVGRGGGRLPMKMPATVPSRTAFTQPPPMRQPPPSGVPSAQMLSGLAPEEQKNVLGERLYTKIQSINYTQAAKITGMLLEMETEEILNVLDDPHLLINKVNEAVAVLRQHDASAH